MSTIIWDRVVKTRKPHRCTACGDQIEVGTATQATGNVDDGQLATCYWCAVCMAFMKTMDPSDLIEGCDLWEEDGYREFRMATFNQCHECERFNIKAKGVTVCTECTPIEVQVFDEPYSPFLAHESFISALEASSGSVPITVENVERRLKMRATLNQVWEAWIQKPNLRLGQLIQAGWFNTGEPQMFYVEDADLVKGVQAMLLPSSEDD